MHKPMSDEGGLLRFNVCEHGIGVCHECVDAAWNRRDLSTTRPTKDLADELEAAFRGYTFTPADPLGLALDRAITALRGPTISEGEVSLDAEYTLTGRQVAEMAVREQKVERRLIVAWLRKQAAMWEAKSRKSHERGAKDVAHTQALIAASYSDHADAIARGYHRITALRSDGLTEPKDTP